MCVKGISYPTRTTQRKSKNTPKKKLEPYQHLGPSSVMEAREHVQPKLAFIFAVICTFSKDLFFQQDDRCVWSCIYNCILQSLLFKITQYFTISLMLQVVWFESQSTSLRCLFESHLRHWNLANCFVLFVLPLLHAKKPHLNCKWYSKVCKKQ